MRIHLGLFFFSGPRLKEMDKRALINLQKIIPIIPILSKSDGLTQQEILEAKINVITEANLSGIQFFDCHSCLPKQKMHLLSNGPLAPCPPFAIISSIDQISEARYGRRYPWGVADIMNPQHSDFGLLYKLLIGYFALPCLDQSKKIYKKWNIEENRKVQEINQQAELEKKQQLLGTGFVAIATFVYFLFQKFK